MIVLKDVVPPLSPADQARLHNLVTVQPDSATVTILDDDSTIAIDKKTKLQKSTVEST